jgi:hypothetical protein
MMKQWMAPAVLAVCLLVIPSQVSAQSTVYTSSATFFANVLPGFYTETFTGNPGVFDTGVSFSSLGFTYVIDAAGGIEPIYRSGTFLGNTYAAQALTITFTSNNVTAIGGNFFLTDVNDNPITGTVTITLSDGTVESFTTTSASDYRGFTSNTNTVITSLELSAPLAAQFNSIDNFTVGVAVPEPASVALITLAIAGIGTFYYRRRKNQDLVIDRDDC